MSDSLRKLLKEIATEAHASLARGLKTNLEGGYNDYNETLVRLAVAAERAVVSPPVSVIAPGIARRARGGQR